MFKRLTPFVLSAAFALAMPLALPACHEHEAGAAKHDCASHAGKPCQMAGHEGKNCPMMADGKPCDEACMKACKEKHGDKRDCAGHASKPCQMAGHEGKPCPMAGHKDKSCPMMADGKPCDEACMKACKEKHGDKPCPMMAGHEGKPCPMAGHKDKSCPMMADGKPCDEACMKACKEKHAGKGCPMMAGHEGKPCMMDGMEKPAVDAALETVPHPGHMGEKSPTAGTGDGVKTCPVSGEPVDEDVTATINGRKVKFCCPSCIKTAEANPAKFITAKTGVPAKK